MQNNYLMDSFICGTREQKVYSGGKPSLLTLDYRTEIDKGEDNGSGKK